MTDDRPVWLEFFAGEAGTAMGIHRAGFRVVCVDNNPKVAKRNPFELVLADAIDDFVELVDRFRPVAIGGGPPCQDYTDLRHRTGKRYPRLIEKFRALCQLTDRPYVIENVEDARPFLIDPITICGSMFDPIPEVDGLLFARHRLFESSLPITAPEPSCDHSPWRALINVHGGGGQRERKGPNGERINRGNKASRAEAQALMGIDWMSVAGMNEAIPPRYSEHIARQVMAHLTERSAA
jgi:DNA (cytosine-5)-methyltransferase 1